MDFTSFMNIPLTNHWGYLIIFIATLTESFPAFGALMPGHTLVVIGGFLAKMKILNLWLVMIIASIGAILGDLVAYVLGHKYGHGLLKRYGKHVSLNEEHYEKTKKLMHEHTWKTLILGRFYFVTRAFAPFVAGATKVPFPKYMACNVVGGISLAIVATMLGYFFGKSYETLARHVGSGVLIATALAIIGVIVYRFINKRKSIFTKYHLEALILNLVSLIVFAKLIDDVIKNDLITKIDLLANDKIVFLWNDSLTKIMIFISNIMSTNMVIVLSAIILLIFIIKKWRYESWVLVSSLAIGTFSQIIIKNIVHRIRPGNSLIFINNYSFPSGHATASIIFFSVLIYVFKDQIKNNILRNAFVIGNVLLFLLVGFSRVYLGVHWPSDVLAGFALGLFWLTFFILFFKWIRSLKRKNIPIIRSI